MTDHSPSLMAGYRAALASYLAGSGEDCLTLAYELGREAITSGRGLLDIVELHAETLQQLLVGQAVPSEVRRALRASEFLAECVAPYEMVTRGFKEKTAQLQELNKLLEQRVAKRTAEAEARSQELARSNAELQQFAYVASHDLQEPLRMVASYVQLLARHYQGQLDGRADEFIAYAVEGATRMQRLINDLLVYSRVGTRGHEFAATDCEAVLGQIISNLALAIEDNQATITHDPLPTVQADPTQLAQVLQNLLANAVKFHGDAPPRVHVGAERRDGAWLFSVRDNGVGIDPQYFDRIFVIFQRLHGREDYPGTGIGLALCKRIVERHGGRIWVESAPGQGSTFYFTVPSGDQALYGRDGSPNARASDSAAAKGAEAPSPAGTSRPPTAGLVDAPPGVATT